MSHSSCKLCPLSQPETQEQIVRRTLLHWKGNLTLPTANSLGLSQTLNYSYLTSYICFQRISNHFITRYLTSILLCRSTWEQSGHCRTTVPLRAVPLQGFAWFLATQQDEFVRFDVRARGWGSSRATVSYQGWDLLHASCWCGSQSNSFSLARDSGSYSSSSLCHVRPSPKAWPVWPAVV